MPTPRILYQDIAPAAKIEARSPTSNDKEDYSDLDNLNLEYLSVPYYTTLEQNDWLLDGGHPLFPSNPTAYRWGYVSDTISGADGTFETPPYVDITFESVQSSVALTLDFDPNRDEWSDVRITYIQRGTTILEQEYQPDNYQYCCIARAVNYDEVKIEFLKTSHPYRRARLAVIYYGIIRTFDTDVLTAVSALEEINVISAELSVNTMTFSVVDSSDINFLFQKMQLIQLLYGNSLIGSYFIESATRTGSKKWEVETQDSVGAMDYYSFRGGIFEKKNAKELVDEVFADVNLPYELDKSYYDEVISGYIPYGSVRESLLRIAFALGAVVDDARGDTIYISPPREDDPIVFDEDSVHLDDSTEIQQLVTRVEVTAYIYSKSDETEQILSATLPVGESEVRCDTPFYGYTITGATITESGETYVKFNVTTAGTVTITGKKYSESTVVYSKSNPDTALFDVDNVVSCSDCQLVNVDNVNDVLERVYNYATSAQTVNGTLILGSAKVGDIVTVPTSYSGTVTGRIVSNKLSFGSKLRGEVSIRVG
jgi:hypothetical protein